MTKNKAKKSGLEFEVPEGWELNTIGDLFHLKNGINAGKESYGVGVKFVNVMEVINSESLDETLIPGSVNISDDQKISYLVKFGDVLFNRTSEITDEVGLSSVYLGKEPIVFGGFVIRATDKNKRLDDYFKKYCFRSKVVRNQVIKGGQGAVRSNIGQGDLEKVIIPLPPLPEQRAIAQVLGKMDEAIQTTERLIAQKELRKKWLMQHLLTGKMRLKGFSGEWREFKIKKIGAIPEKTPVNELNGQRLLTVKLHTKGVEFNNSDKPVISQSGRPYYERFEGEILIGRQNIHNGGIGVVQKEHSGHICSNAISSFKVHETFSSEFLLYYLQHPDQYKSIETFMGGTGQKELSEKQFLNLQLTIPASLEEQTAIARVLQTADQEISLLKAKADKLREQKKGMMQVLLTGKVRIKVGKENH